MTDELATIILAIIGIISGICLEHLLFVQHRNCRTNRKYITSEYLIKYILSILSVIVGCMITIAITNIDANNQEKESAYQAVDSIVEIGSKNIIVNNNGINYYKYKNTESSGYKDSLDMITDYYAERTQELNYIADNAPKLYYYCSHYIEIARILNNNYLLSRDKDSALKLQSETDKALYKSLMFLKLSEYYIDEKFSDDELELISNSITDSNDLVELSNIVEKYNLGLATFKKVKVEDLY